MAVGDSNRSNKANMTVLAKKAAPPPPAPRGAGRQSRHVVSKRAERLVGILDRSMAKPLSSSILSAVRVRLPKSLCKTVKIARAEIGNGPITDAVIGPLDEIVAGDCLPLGHIGHRGRNGDKADQVLAMPVDQRRHRRAIDHVDASADQGKAHIGEVDDARRLRDAPAEPWLD